MFNDILIVYNFLYKVWSMDHQRETQDQKGRKRKITEYLEGRKYPYPRKSGKFAI